MRRQLPLGVWAVVFAAAPGLLASACASPGTYASAWVTVTVDFSPSRLPPEDVFLQVMLEERSESGQSRTVGRATERITGRVPPVEVRVLYDPGQIEQTARYEVKAWIEQRGRTLIPESRGEPVLTMGGGNTAVIRLRY
jgi:uncharacterized lipoprotein YbaY